MNISYSYKRTIKVPKTYGEIECLLHPEQYNLLWKTSFSALASSISAYYNGYYECALLGVSVFATSLNYWRYPTYSWRRNIDIGAVHFTIFYHLWLAIKSKSSYLHFACLFTGLSCYPISIYYYKQNRYWISTYLHSCVHIIANTAYIIMFCEKLHRPEFTLLKN